MRRPVGALAGLGLGSLAFAALLTACGGATAAGGPAASSGGGGRTVTVFAAASLQKSFTAIGRQFQAAHPGTTVAFSFAGSSDLAAQIANGAPADVFASADARTMGKVTGAGLADGEPADFATNVLTIAVRPGNPAGIKGLADLARPGLRLVDCAPQVPCGAAAQAAAGAAHVALAPVSQESNVTDVLGKVVSGEADAGLVYATDARGAGGKVAAVPFPEAASAVNRYPVAVLRDAKDKAFAHEFADYVAGPEGRKVLADAGFGAP
ncbi:molybdate transport system substrate-binding protein [Sinomonas atrocyanea]|uniref:molybdate ABC transporter substrate-binding protein n=1 Tax=Sinomonas atrocyanea TaxID=37927 RepID=UPI00277DF7F1|nr:molybdate ABC transporter substrate-binding protein [Sinomonas atrocyanea]MDP9882932.1 molybdate transport system substrate-binding protein [Sinomonas atrocyanea]